MDGFRMDSIAFVMFKLRYFATANSFDGRNTGATGEKKLGRPPVSKLCYTSSFKFKETNSFNNA